KYTKHSNIKTDHLGKSKFVVHSKKIKKKKSLIYGELQNYRGKVGLNLTPDSKDLSDRNK
ncbi:MAG: hypothetical protein ACRCSR_09735, partial [Bacteroidales bacterium]